MLHPDPALRFSMKQVSEHPWMTKGEMASAEEVKEYIEATLLEIKGPRIEQTVSAKVEE